MEKLGIELPQLLTQVVNFTIMVFILTKFLYKPILKTLEERKRKIEEGLKFTEKVKEEIEKTEKNRQEIIDKAKTEARQIIEETKNSAKRLESEIITKAHKEAEEILIKGRKELEQEKIEMEKAVSKHTVDIAAHMVEKLLNKMLSKEDHEALIEKKLREIARIGK